MTDGESLAERGPRALEDLRNRLDTEPSARLLEGLLTAVRTCATEQVLLTVGLEITPELAEARPIADRMIELLMGELLRRAEKGAGI